MSEHRRKLGPVYSLAPFEAHSAHYNPLDFIRAGWDFELKDARLIAEMLVVPEISKPNHWQQIREITRPFLLP